MTWHPLTAVAGAGALFSLLVLCVSGWSFAALARQGALTREYLLRRGWLDALLLVVWMLMLTSCLALLRRQQWGASGLLLSVQVLFAWSWATALLRLRDLARLEDTFPVRWGPAVAGHALLVGAVGGVLYLLDGYLRSPAVQELLR